VLNSSADLKASWAQLFKKKVLPILIRSEERFSMLYGITGRPNFSVSRMLGLCLLQELNDLSDQQALDTFGFDIRWRYALDMSDEQAYLSSRSFSLPTIRKLHTVVVK
jgi:transposase